jgi:hypothetical protein
MLQVPQEASMWHNSETVLTIVRLLHVARIGRARQRRHEVNDSHSAVRPPALAKEVNLGHHEYLERGQRQFINDGSPQ